MRQIVGQQGRFSGRISMTRADFGDHAAVRRNGRKGRRRDRAYGVAERRQRKLQPVETVCLALQEVSGARHLVATQRLDMTVVEMRRSLGNGLAMAGDEADDVDLLFQDPEGRIGHLGEINGILDNDAPVLRLQHRGVVGANPELARLGGLLVEVDGVEAEMPVLARGDRQQVLGVDRVLVRMVVEIGQRDVAPQPSSTDSSCGGGVLPASRLTSR